MTAIAATCREIPACGYAPHGPARRDSAPPFNDGVMLAPRRSTQDLIKRVPGHPAAREIQASLEQVILQPIKLANPRSPPTGVTLVTLSLNHLAHGIELVT